MENPEIIAGIPMLILGSIGLLVAILLTIAPAEDGARRLSASRVALMVFVALMIIAVMKTALIGFFFMRVMRISAAHREDH